MSRSPNTAVYYGEHIPRCPTNREASRARGSFPLYMLGILLTKAIATRSVRSYSFTLAVRHSAALAAPHRSQELVALGARGFYRSLLAMNQVIVYRLAAICDQLAGLAAPWVVSSYEE